MNNLCEDIIEAARGLTDVSEIMEAARNVLRRNTHQLNVFDAVSMTVSVDNHSSSETISNLFTRNQLDETSSTLVEPDTEEAAELTPVHIVPVDRVFRNTEDERDVLQILSGLYRENYEFRLETVNVNSIEHILAHIIPIDHRLNIIRDLQCDIFCNICCLEHHESARTYTRLFEYILAQRTNWDEELLDYGYNYLLRNLRLLRAAMEHHIEEVENLEPIVMLLDLDRD